LIAEVVYVVSTCLIKIAFSITLLRIIDRRIYICATYATYAVILIALVTSLFFFFYALFSCKPVSYLWKQVDGSETGTCTPPHQLLITPYVNSMILFTCDTSLAIIPAFLLSKLRLSWKTKVAAGFLLGLGAL
jgi:hypothetical protein